MDWIFFNWNLNFNVVETCVSYTKSIKKNLKTQITIKKLDKRHKMKIVIWTNRWKNDFNLTSSALITTWFQGFSETSMNEQLIPFVWRNICSYLARRSWTNWLNLDSDQYEEVCTSKFWELYFYQQPSGNWLSFWGNGIYFPLQRSTQTSSFIFLIKFQKMKEKQQESWIVPLSKDQ